MDLIPQKYNPKWRETFKVKGISKQDLLEGKNGVEKIKGLSKGFGKVFSFGKYKGRAYSDIQESDPKYFSWCEENVKDFKK